MPRAGKEIPWNGEAAKSRVKQLNRRSDARPGSVCLVAAVIDGVSDLGFCVI
jgi:hypothetical protein